jgi:hypothetical protein
MADTGRSGPGVGRDYDASRETAEEAAPTVEYEPLVSRARVLPRSGVAAVDGRVSDRPGHRR